MDHPCCCFAWAYTINAVLWMLGIWAFSALIYPML